MAVLLGLGQMPANAQVSNYSELTHSVGRSQAIPPTQEVQEQFPTIPN